MPSSGWSIAVVWTILIGSQAHLGLFHRHFLLWAFTCTFFSLWQSQWYESRTSTKAKHCIEFLQVQMRNEPQKIISTVSTKLNISETLTGVFQALVFFTVEQESKKLMPHSFIHKVYLKHVSWWKGEIERTPTCIWKGWFTILHIECDKEGVRRQFYTLLHELHFGHLFPFTFVCKCGM